VTELIAKIDEYTTKIWKPTRSTM